MIRFPNRNIPETLDELDYQLYQCDENMVIYGKSLGENKITIEIDLQNEYYGKFINDGIRKVEIDFDDLEKVMAKNIILKRR